MRIIDADEFKKQAAAVAIQIGTEKAARRCKLILSLIDQQPTVYDVENKEVKDKEI